MTLLDGSGQAPVVVSDMLAERKFSRPAGGHEMITTEYELIQPDGAEPALYHYETRSGMIARRYWALKRYLLVGGNIRDVSDWLHLHRDLGVTHVLSFEAEFEDDGIVSNARRARAPFPDNGRPPPLELMIRTVKWVLDLPKSGVVLYCHCHLGASRGPTAAYLALRARWYMDRSAAQKYAGRRQGGEQLYKTYLDVVDRAILEVCGR